MGAEAFPPQHRAAGDRLEPQGIAACGSWCGRRLGKVSARTALLGCPPGKARRGQPGGGRHARHWSPACTQTDLSELLRPLTYQTVENAKSKHPSGFSSRTRLSVQLSTQPSINDTKSIETLFRRPSPSCVFLSQNSFAVLACRKRHRRLEPKRSSSRTPPKGRPSEG